MKLNVGEYIYNSLLLLGYVDNLGASRFGQSITSSNAFCLGFSPIQRANVPNWDAPDNLAHWQYFSYRESWE